MKIIIVDDEIASLSMFLPNLVDRSDVEYRFFRERPFEAEAYAKNNRIDGAFLDINMPDINGVDLAALLIKDNPAVKIVFITGYVYDEKAIQDRLGENLLGFAYKPFDRALLDRYLRDIFSEAQKPKIVVQTFGSFDFFVNNSPLKFTSSKSKELLALLVAYHGGTLTMDDAVCHLWPEKDVDLAKKLYRDAVWRLRKTLKNYGILFVVDFGRAQASIDLEGIECDYWNYLEKPDDSYQGEFLTDYDWSIDFQNRLDCLA
jgi:two-component system LytT family response regulator